MRLAGTAALWLVAAAAAGPAHAADRLPEAWKFEARSTHGEVKVLPLLELEPEIAVDLRSFVGAPLPWSRVQTRLARTADLERVVPAVGEALPGAVNGQLGLRWDGQFHHDRWPVGAQDRVRAAISGRRDLDDTLIDVATAVGGEATLFTWVREVEGRPVSLDGFPGEVVDTAVGPVLVDHADEPYVVWVRMGVALVTSDGEVLIRYEDPYVALLSERITPDRTAADIARNMAREVVKVWALDADFAGGPLLAHQDGVTAIP